MPKNSVSGIEKFFSTVNCCNAWINNLICKCKKKYRKKDSTPHRHLLHWSRAQYLSTSEAHTDPAAESDIGKRDARTASEDYY